MGNDFVHGHCSLCTVTFNPRSRVGNDKVFQADVSQVFHFQSTFPRGERPSKILDSPILATFNPRSRVGNDWTIRTAIQEQSLLSIHVPAWGTTPLLFHFNEQSGLSIHVPAWGTTKPRRGYAGQGLLSIHVPAWGTTLCI